jgi:hypothetical protein
MVRDYILTAAVLKVLHVTLPAELLPGAALSHHKQGWEQFTDEVVRSVNRYWPLLYDQLARASTCDCRRYTDRYDKLQQSSAYLYLHCITKQHATAVAAAAATPPLRRRRRRRRCRQKRTVVFMLWGKPSQEKGGHINRSRHRVITSSHPSPLGATKTKEPFTGSRCFARANELLRASGQEPIDWNIE